MNLTPRSLLRAIPLAAVALAPELARAHNLSCGDPYYDPCNAFSGWIDIAVLGTDKIPIALKRFLSGIPQRPWVLGRASALA